VGRVNITVRITDCDYKGYLDGLCAWICDRYDLSERQRADDAQAYLRRILDEKRIVHHLLDIAAEKLSLCVESGRITEASFEDLIDSALMPVNFDAFKQEVDSWRR
jgi:hypothetical protein